MSFIEKFGPLIGRVLIALLFVPEGFSKVTNFSGTVDYITANGLPMPQVLAAAAIVIEIGAGLALLIGIGARWAALVLCVFSLLTAFRRHGPGRRADDAEPQLLQGPRDRGRAALHHGLRGRARVGGFARRMSACPMSKPQRYSRSTR